MKQCWTILFGLGLCLSFQAHAETLAMSSMDSLKPLHTGQTMEQIEQKLGEPQQRLQSVGEPPIIRWQYADQTVYFEQNEVIHTVQHKASN